MMMDCPRCGFTQPKDKYCASCGLDVESFNAKPKPLMVRILQNPNVHLSLIGVLIAVIVGYIFYTQRLTVGRQVVALLNGTPLRSRDALDPDARRAAREAKRAADEAAAQRVSKETVTEAPPPAPVAEAPKAAAAAPVEVTKVDISYWEVPREAFTNLASTADKVGEGNGGRSYWWSAGEKATKAVEAVTAGKRISVNRNLPMESGAQIAIETPPTTPESFQFGLYFQITKPEGKDWNLKWESQMVLPPPEAATPEAVASRQPVVRGLAESQLAGQSAMAPGSTLLLVYEPTTRMVREDSLVKAGEGPWSIFSSDEFKAGTSEWVVLVQLK